jgi:2-desacetyl-2-hydroxyethyl bacteriochlorophyllide A dehydrogenase
VKTKMAYLIKPGQFEIRECEIRHKADEVLVKVAVCGLCNWELNHWKGLLSSYPQTLGHEWAGEVVEVGSDVKSLKVGDKVAYLPGELAGFSEYAVAKEEHCFKLQQYVNLQEALGEPLKCIITVLRAAAVEAGDFGVVVGCGPMGLWCMQGLAGYLSNIVAIDIDDSKLELAEKFGATHTINPKNKDVVENLSLITDGRMADFVIEGTGNPVVLNNSIDYLKSTGRGRLVLMSSHEKTSQNFDFRKLIEKSAALIAAHPSYSLNTNDDMRRAIDYINMGKFSMNGIITHRFTLENINAAFEALENKPEGYLKGVIKF